MYEESDWVLIDDDLQRKRARERAHRRRVIQRNLSPSPLMFLADALTLRIKSGGVPGLTVGLRTPSWCEWISVSSRSRTRIFLFTASVVYSRNHTLLS